METADKEEKSSKLFSNVNNFLRLWWLRALLGIFMSLEKHIFTEKKNIFMEVVVARFKMEISLNSFGVRKLVGSLSEREQVKTKLSQSMLALIPALHPPPKSYSIVMKRYAFHFHNIHKQT